MSSERFVSVLLDTLSSIASTFSNKTNVGLWPWQKLSMPRKVCAEAPLLLSCDKTNLFLSAELLALDESLQLVPINKQSTEGTGHSFPCRLHQWNQKMDHVPFGWLQANLPWAILGLPRWPCLSQWSFPRTRPSWLCVCGPKLLQKREHLLNCAIALFLAERCLGIQNRIHLYSLSRSSSPEFLCQKYIRSRPCLGPRFRALFHSNCPYISTNFFLGAINRPPMWRTMLRVFLASRRDFLFCNLLQSGPPSLCCLIQSFLAFRNETCSAWFFLTETQLK